MSVRNELKAMKRFNELCKEYLSYYPTTYVEDCEKLLDLDLMPMYSNIRNACIQVKGEKEVLLFYQSLTSMCIDLLNILDSGSPEEIANIHNTARQMYEHQHYFVMTYMKLQLMHLFPRQSR